MPIYEYRCERGHTFEVLQRMTDDPVTICTSCDAGVQRVLHPVAVHFKGSGFYSTDYAKKGRATDSSDAGEAKKNGSGGESSSKGEKKGETSGSSSAASGD